MTSPEVSSCPTSNQSLITKYRRAKHTIPTTEIADYIIGHGGPDDKGRAHPDLAKIQIEDLEGALQVAHRRGLSREVTPILFRGVFNLRTRKAYVDKLVVRKVLDLIKTDDYVKSLDQISLKDPKIQALVLSLCTAPNLKQEITVTRNKKPATLSYHKLIAGYFSNEPMQFAKYFLRLVGNHQLAEKLEPIDMPSLSRKTRNGGQSCLAINAPRIMTISIRNLLEKGTYKNVPDLIRNISTSDVNKYQRTRWGVKITGNAAAALGELGSLYASVMAYLGSTAELSESNAAYLDPKTGLQVFHLSRISRAHLQSEEGPATLDLMMTRKIANQLCLGYEHDFEKFKRTFQYKDLFESFTDYVGTAGFEVKMKNLPNFSGFKNRGEVLSFMEANETEILKEAERQQKLLRRNNKLF